MFFVIPELALIFVAVFTEASTEAMFVAINPLAFIHHVAVCKVDGSVTMTSAFLPHAIVSFPVFKVASALAMFVAILPLANVLLFAVFKVEGALAMFVAILPLANVLLFARFKVVSA